MTSTTSTPPCLGEREAVARTLVDAFEEAVRQEVREARLMCGADPVPAVNQRKLCRAGLDEHIVTLRTENETLRVRAEAAELELSKVATVVRSAAIGEWSDAYEAMVEESCAWEARALTAEAERDAAIARAEEARLELVNLRIDINLNERPIYSRRQIIEARDAALSEASDLTAKLAQAEGEIATMRGAINDIAGKCELARAVYATEETANPTRAAEAFALIRDVARRALTSPEPPHGD